MEAVLNFMGMHPFLTFFLALVVFNGTATIIGAIRGIKCKCQKDED